MQGKLLSKTIFLILVVMAAVFVGSKVAELQSRNKQPSSGSAPVVSSADACGSLAEPDKSFCQRDFSEIKSLTNCGDLSSAELKKECLWRQAIINLVPSQCDQLAAKEKDICYWDVSVARFARGNRQQKDFSLCEEIEDATIQEACRSKSYAID